MPSIGAARFVEYAQRVSARFVVATQTHAEVVVRPTRPSHVADVKAAVRPSRSLARALMQQRRIADVRQALVGVGLRLVGVRIERTDRQVNERADRSFAGAEMQDALAPGLGKAWIGPLGLAGAVFIDDAVFGDELRTHASRLAGWHRHRCRNNSGENRNRPCLLA